MTCRDEAREKAAVKAGADGDSALALLIRQFQFNDIRPKAASENELTHASRLLEHTTEGITKKVYRRVGEIVKPTKLPAACHAARCRSAFPNATKTAEGWGTDPKSQALKNPVDH